MSLARSYKSPGNGALSMSRSPPFHTALSLFLRSLTIHGPDYWGASGSLRTCHHRPMEAIVRAQIPSSSLISLAAARLALAQVTDVSAVATLVDRLEVVRVAARKARLSLEAQNDWATL